MTKAKISTSYGDITVRLYDETPLHRDNFLKLVKEGFYNGTLFHRVIKNFMIQGGDPDSKGAKAGARLGSGDVGYTIPAEFNPSLFHKRGALAAARQGDNVNPERRSSGCQFYIVWGDVYKGDKLQQLEGQMVQQVANGVFQRLAQERIDIIREMQRNRDMAGLNALQEQLVEMAMTEAATKPESKLSDEQKRIYSELGGTPFLDGQYTVFGEVVEGLDVVAKIQECSTDGADRPVKDIKMEVVVLE